MRNREHIDLNNLEIFKIFEKLRNSKFEFRTVSSNDQKVGISSKNYMREATSDKKKTIVSNFGISWYFAYFGNFFETLIKYLPKIRGFQ